MGLVIAAAPFDVRVPIAGSSDFLTFDCGSPLVGAWRRHNEHEGIAVTIGSNTMGGYTAVDDAPPSWPAPDGWCARPARRRLLLAALVVLVSAAAPSVAEAVRARRAYAGRGPSPQG